MENINDPIIKEFVETTAIEMAQELYEECDGSYVGAEMKSCFEIDGVVFDITVAAFWEKSFHCDYKATSRDTEFTGSICIG